MSAQLQFAAWYTQIVCYKCSISFFVPNNYYRDRQNDSARFFCPAGHGQIFTDGNIARLEKQLAQQRKRTEWAESARDQARSDAKYEGKRASAFKGHLARTRKRVAHGVCPCCNRTFKQLARHMSSQHPDYAVGVE